MATFVFFASEPQQRRADGRNTAVAQGADVGAARSAAESLIGQPGALEGFAVVEITSTSPPFLIEGHLPIGGRGQTVWPTVGRGGDRLPGA